MARSLVLAGDRARATALASAAGGAARAQLQPEHAGQLDQRRRRPALARLGRDAAGGSLSDDGGRSFRAPLSTSAFRSAQVAQATLLADGKTLIGDADRVVGQQFTPPRWSADGGATWQAGRARAAPTPTTTSATTRRLRRRVARSRRIPADAAHGLVLPGQPLRHARRRPHLGGGHAALRSARGTARRSRSRPGKRAHAAPARAVEGRELQARARQAAAQRRRRRDLAHASRRRASRSSTTTATRSPFDPVQSPRPRS